MGYDSAAAVALLDCSVVLDIPRQGKSDFELAEKGWPAGEKAYAIWYSKKSWNVSATRRSTPHIPFVKDTRNLLMLVNSASPSSDFDNIKIASVVFWFRSEMNGTMRVLDIVVSQ